MRYSIEVDENGEKALDYLQPISDGARAADQLPPLRRDELVGRLFLLALHSNVQYYQQHEEEALLARLKLDPEARAAVRLLLGAPPPPQPLAAADLLGAVKE